VLSFKPLIDNRNISFTNRYIIGNSERRTGFFPLQLIVTILRMTSAGKNFSKRVEVVISTVLGLKKNILKNFRAGLESPCITIRK